jgi:Tol biopolymer transport system component
MSWRRTLLCVASCLCVSTVLSGAARDRILFARLGPAHGELFVSNADGTGERALTPPGSLDYNPTWSSTGNWIVFTSERDGSADLYRVHADGTGLERLTDSPAFDDQATASPDGRRIAFVTTRAAGFANLAILDVATRDVTPLTSGNGGNFRPAWSPDGRWIAFSSDRASDLPSAANRWERLHVTAIYLIRPDGTGLKRISALDDACGGPAWTHDSAHVVAYCMSPEDTWTYRDDVPAGNTRLVSIDAATGKTTPVAAGTGVKISPAVLSSGQVAYVRSDKPKGVFYADGKAGPAGADVRTPSWSPDGTHVVYSRFASADRSVVPVPRWSRNPAYELFTTKMLPSYAPDGRSFAVTQPITQTTMALIVVTDGQPRTIFTPDSLVLGPQWSPDGKQMVVGVGRFTAFLGEATGDPVNGGAQVGIINADGSGFHVVTSGTNNNAFGSFAPDGRRIVFRTEGPEGEGLRIMTLADRAVTVLTRGYDNFPVWSPKGDRIAFIRRTGRDFQVFTIQPDGSGLRQLTRTRGNDAHVSWSPDGERLAFSSSRMGFKDEVVNTEAPQPYGEIFVMRADGTHLEQLTDNQWEEAGATWQPHPAAATVP